MCIRDRSDIPKNQIFLTTHTPEIAKICLGSNLVHLIRDQNRVVNVDGGNSDDRMKRIAETLGVLPYLCKFCVLVEGNRDVLFLTKIGNNIQELKGIFDLEAHSDVSILPLVGENLVNWITRGYIQNSNIKAFYLFDKDNQDYIKKAEEVNEMNDENKAQTTTFLMMENYIAPSLVEEYFSIKFDDASKNNWGEQNIITLIADKKNIDKKDVKNKLNKEVAPMITKTHFEEIGAWNEVKGWFSTIADMYRSR